LSPREVLHVDKLPAKISVSGDAGSPCFSIVGTSFIAIVMQIHYDRACDLLKQLDLQIIEIRFRLGFQDPAHFPRFFRNFSGQTSCEYRTTLPS